MLRQEPFEVLLSNVSTLIDEYHNEAWNSDQLSRILKDLTAHLFYLEKYRSDFHNQYNQIMHGFTGTAARAKIEADDKVPQLYMLRRIMTAAYRCVDGLRSNISMIKKES